MGWEISTDVFLYYSESSDPFIDCISITHLEPVIMVQVIEGKPSTRVSLTCVLSSMQMGGVASHNTTQAANGSSVLGLFTEELSVLSLGVFITKQLLTLSCRVSEVKIRLVFPRTRSFCSWELCLV